MITIVPDPAITIVPPTETLEVQQIQIDVVTAPGSTTPVAIRDVDYLATTSATTRRDGQIVAQLNPTSNRSISYLSSDPSAVTVDSQGYCQSVTNFADANIIVSSPWNIKSIKVQGRILGGQTSNIFQNYRTGSASAHIVSTLNTLVTNSQQKNVYTTRDNSVPTYVRNPNCWINADLTPWAAWCTTAQPAEYKFCGMLISPRHLVLATHCNNGAGTFRFVANDGTIVDRTLTNRVNIAGFDLSIGVLNADVPSSISFAKVLPQNWANYLTFVSLPVIAGDQEGKVVARNATLYGVAGTAKYLTHYLINSGPLAAVSEEIIPGDSGSPVFTIIDGQVVVLGTHYTANACPLISAYWTEVNANMTFLGGGYQLTPIDLSGYIFYV